MLVCRFGSTISIDRFICTFEYSIFAILCCFCIFTHTHTHTHECAHTREQRICLNDCFQFQIIYQFMQFEYSTRNKNTNKNNKKKKKDEFKIENIVFVWLPRCDTDERINESNGKIIERKKWEKKKIIVCAVLDVRLTNNILYKYITLCCVRFVPKHEK